MPVKEFFNGLLGIARDKKRLTIMATGYLYHHQPPLGALAIISNYQNIDTGIPSSEAWDDFRCFFRTELRPHAGNIALFFHVGTLPPIREADSAKVVELVKARKPAAAIVGKLVELFRQCSESPQGGKLIGRQLNSIILPREPSREVQCGYHSDIVKQETYLPDHIIVVSDKLHMNVIDVSVKPADPTNTPPLSGPRLRPGQLCWCDSGKKFKRCHGRTSKKRVPFRLVAKDGA